MLRGSIRLRHRVVSVTVAAGVVALLPADPRRLRALMFNASAPATGSTVYVGASVDVVGAALAAANGWPLREEAINDVENKYWKTLANVLELFTQDTVYALVTGATATIKILEELS